MKSSVKNSSVIFIIILFSSCATIVSKSKWSLKINSNPTAANVQIIDKKGIVIYNGKTPAEVKLKSGAGFFVKQAYSVKLSMEGYTEKTIPVECSLNGWYIGNIIFGGLVGLLIVDPATGAMYRLKTKSIDEILSPITSNNDMALKIININDLPSAMKEHLVLINY